MSWNALDFNRNSTDRVENSYLLMIRERKFFIMKIVDYCLVALTTKIFVFSGDFTQALVLLIATLEIMEGVNAQCIFRTQTLIDII